MIRTLKSFWKSRTLRAGLSLVVTLFVFTWPSHAAYVANARRTSNVEQRLLADATDGQFDQHSLVVAALIASGTTGPMLYRLQARFESLANEFTQSLEPRMPALERASVLRKFLHTRILSHYRTDASDLAVTLETGDFNCVTASVLFVALAQRVGITAYAVQLPEHVR
jgi:hypothetical protein